MQKKFVDAKGNLVSESFVNGHLHLCKVYTLEKAGQKALQEYQQGGMGNALDSIQSAFEFKTCYEASWIAENVRKVCELAVKYGVTHIRAFADVDSKGKLEGIKALLKVREEYKQKVELQVVAFPQDGVLREPGTKGLIEEALNMGADVVGGIPWIEYTKENEQEHIDQMCKLAEKYNKDISMLLDDVGDAEERTLEMLCKKVIEMGWQGRVTAQHCRAMSLYSENYFRKLIQLANDAGIAFCDYPHTGPLHLRVKRSASGAAFPIACDRMTLRDAYYPYGERNMLQVAFLASHLLWMTTFKDMEELYSMVTTYAGKVLGASKSYDAGKVEMQIWWCYRIPMFIMQYGIISANGCDKGGKDHKERDSRINFLKRRGKYFKKWNMKESKIKDKLRILW